MSTPNHSGQGHASQDHASQDQKFLNLFMLVIGALIGVTVCLIFVARAIAGNTQLAWVMQDPAYAAAVDARIKPAGQVGLPGDEPAGGAPAVVAPEAAAPVAAKLTGKQVYDATCFACHAAGVGGAPKFGDAAAWAPRKAHGIATLNQHALQGFQGQSGVMPPKGGRVDLSDEEIISAVAYISGS